MTWQGFFLSLLDMPEHFFIVSGFNSFLPHLTQEWEKYLVLAGSLGSNPGPFANCNLKTTAPGAW